MRTILLKTYNVSSKEYGGTGEFLLYIGNTGGGSYKAIFSQNEIYILFYECI